jgi:hypothetical protein
MIDSMTTYHFAAVIEKDGDGWFAFCPELQCCYTSGETFEDPRPCTVTKKRPDR